MRKWLMLGVIVAGSLVFPAVVPARILENWPYDRLFKEADLVIIATAVKTEAADDKPPKHNWPLEFVAQNTTFKHKHILKGKSEAEQIKVLHFKFGDKLKKGVKPEDFAINGIIDDPLFVEFRVEYGLDYLLFLKRLKDGRYEPVSGRIDPELSVRELSAPQKKVAGPGGM